MDYNGKENSAQNLLYLSKLLLSFTRFRNVELGRILLYSKLTYYLCTFGVKPPDVLVEEVIEPPDMASKLKSANIVINSSCKEVDMQIIVGYILILLGVAFLVVSVLVWFNVIQPKFGVIIQESTGWDVLIALIDKLPWMAIVGLVLIYAGLKMIGVGLPF